MKKFVLSIICVFIFVFVALTYIGNYFYDVAINRDTATNLLMGKFDIQSAVEQSSVYRSILYASTDVEESSTDDSFAAEVILENQAVEQKWSITSYDGYALKGVCYMQPEHSDKWLVAVHGYRGSRSQVISPALSFFAKGYNVLAIDCRGHGESEGKYIGMGWHDRIDVLAWIKEVLRVSPNSEIVLYGISMGGATVLMTAGEAMPKNVAAVISDCAYSDVYSQFAYQVKTFLKMPEFPLVSATSLICSIRANYLFEEATALSQVKKSSVPILFIHGDLDKIVPVSMAYQLYESATGEKELLVVRGAKHGVSYSENPDLYWTTVFSFLDKYVK
ncbi:MAG: alpha/beta hydrolase [Eubacteriales bacterium]|nr:alpha/beta hydrolase [Eubacteriales bacterium]